MNNEVARIYSPKNVDKTMEKWTNMVRTNEGRKFIPSSRAIMKLLAVYLKY